MTWCARQQARIDLGLCPRCGGDVPAPGNTRCASCRDKDNLSQRRLYAKRKKLGIRYSAEEKLAMKVFARQLRESRRAASQCIQCGAKITKYTRCNKCRVQATERTKRYQSRQLLEAA